MRRNRLRMLVWGGAAGLLALPAIAMRLGADGVDWSATDFIVFATMLAVACGLYELAMRMSGDARYRAAAGVAVATGFHHGVGQPRGRHDPGARAIRSIWPSPACSRVAVVGAAFARLRAPGMARAMLAAGIAQALVVAAAFAVGGDTAAQQPARCSSRPGCFRRRCSGVRRNERAQAWRGM